MKKLETNKDIIKSFLKKLETNENRLSHSTITIFRNYFPISGFQSPKSCQERLCTHRIFS